MKHHYVVIVVSVVVAIFFLSCKKERSCEGCKENKPPIAIAGPDQVITLPTDSISLDGSASNDPDGTISEWLWKKISGPALFNVINSSSSKTVVRNLATGIYQFELKVTDDKGSSANDTMQVIVDAVITINHPPVANAGTDQTITLPANTVTLNGSASADPDNNIATYLWTKISGPSLFSITNATAIQTQVTNLVQGNYKFELNVTDSGGLFSRDTMEVAVNPVLNHPPVANAGNDTTITLPSNAINLDGSRSTDPDNNIAIYLWTKISGPSSFNITNANAVQTQVTNLVQGNYKFELKVTDAGGLFSKDTMQVTITSRPPPPTNECPPANRPIINAQLIPVGNLSLARTGIAATAANNKLFYAGGYNASGVSSRVDIYDLATNTWSTSELSIARDDIVTAVSGDKVLFAGGYNPAGRSTRVDIYNLTTQSWSTAELSEARYDMAVGVLGSKVFFAGGLFNGNNPNPLVASSRVDIYDAASNVWSTATLCEARGAIAAVATENKILFAGGYVGDNSGLPSNKIDIYNAITSTWSTSALKVARAFFAGINDNSKIYWAGGQVEDIYSGDWGGTCNVEVQNTNGQIIDSAYLAGAISHIRAFKKDNKILYLWGFDPGPIQFDIHDPFTNNWSIGIVNQSGVPFTRSILAANNDIYVAGGSLGAGGGGGYTSQVWTLEF